MDRKAWDELAVAVIARLQPRIDPKWVPGLELELAGGEYAMAVLDLARILERDRIPVTAAEREDLQRLLTDLGEGQGATAGLHVTAPDQDTTPPDSTPGSAGGLSRTDGA